MIKEWQHIGGCGRVRLRISIGNEAKTVAKVGHPQNFLGGAVVDAGLGYGPKGSNAILVQVQVCRTARAGGEGLRVLVREDTVSLIARLTSNGEGPMKVW